MFKLGVNEVRVLLLFKRMPDHCKFKLSPNLFFRQKTNKFHHCAGLSVSKRMIHVAERRLVNFYFILSIFLFCLL